MDVGGNGTLALGQLVALPGGADATDQVIRIPRITRWLDLPGEYDGLRVRCWVNAPNRLVAEFQTGDEDRIKAVLCRLFVEHNGWADADGEPLAPPTEPAFWADIPTELAALTIQTFIEAVVARPQSLIARPAR